MWTRRYFRTILLVPRTSANHSATDELPGKIFSKRAAKCILHRVLPSGNFREGNAGDVIFSAAASGVGAEQRQSTLSVWDFCLWIEVAQNSFDR